MIRSGWRIFIQDESRHGQRLALDTTHIQASEGGKENLFVLMSRNELKELKIFKEGDLARRAGIDHDTQVSSIEEGLG